MTRHENLNNEIYSRLLEVVQSSFLELKLGQKERERESREHRSNSMRITDLRR